MLRGGAEPNAIATDFLECDYPSLASYMKDESGCDETIAKLESKLIDMLDTSSIEYTRNGGKSRLPGLLSLSFPGADGEAILHRLDLTGICISTGSACNSKSTEISHVLQAIRLEDSYAKGTIRISLGKANTEEEVEAIFKALAKIFRA